MTTELFPIDPPYPPPLIQARRNYEEARKTFEEELNKTIEEVNGTLVVIDIEKVKEAYEAGYDLFVIQNLLTDALYYVKEKDRHVLDKLYACLYGLRKLHKRLREIERSQA